MSDIHALIRDLEDKAKLAEKLTEFPWVRSTSRSAVVDAEHRVIFESYGLPVELCSYVAAAHPVNILALIAHIRRVEDLLAGIAISVIQLIAKVDELEEAAGCAPTFNEEQLGKLVEHTLAIKAMAARG